MVKRVLDRIDNKEVLEWYQSNVAYNFLNELVNNAEQKGYSLDPNSGLLFRKPFSDETIKKLGVTVLDIIFPRPTDFHYHEDISEAISVTDGKGSLYWSIPGLNFPNVKEDLKIESKHYIEKRLPHGFSPDPETGFLEIKLICSGIFNPEKEVCLQKFNDSEYEKRRSLIDFISK